MDIRSVNREAWNRHVERKNTWTLPVDPQAIEDARQGRWQIVLTPTVPVPASWLPPLSQARVLCLASGGGQQGPILAAAGALVTVFDNSPRQLDQDRLVAEREGLSIRIVEGDMRDLSAFDDGTFDLIIHPVSNCFVPDVRPVWDEAFRVLCPGGTLLSGFANPVGYVFDPQMEKEGIYQVRFAIPYSDLTSLSEAERLEIYGDEEPIEFGHTLEDQIGGQVDAGFVIAGLYEDIAPSEPIAELIPTFIATRALKPE